MQKKLYCPLFAIIVLLAMALSACAGSPANPNGGTAPNPTATSQAGVPDPTQTAATQVPQTGLDLSKVNWVPIKGTSIYGGVSGNGYLPVTLNGVDMLFPLESQNVTDKSNGRYESREPAAGEHGDWNPHTYLVLIEVPEEFYKCAEAMFDISWRYFIGGCNVVVPFRFTIADNPYHYDGVNHKVDRDKTSKELEADYLTLGTQKSVGIFVAGVAQEDILDLYFGNEETQVGVGCYDCPAHTAGPSGEFIPLDENITHTGSDSPAPSGEVPPGVFPMTNPKDGLNSITFVVVLDAREMGVVWAGQYVPNPK